MGADKIPNLTTVGVITWYKHHIFTKKTPRNHNIKLEIKCLLRFRFDLHIEPLFNLFLPSVFLIIMFLYVKSLTLLNRLGGTIQTFHFSK